jgi:leucyl/phenylalanyl-tRNA---protein transferase
MNSLSPEILLDIYRRGIFPMADPFDGSLDFYDPDWRAIIPLENYKPPKSLRPILKSNLFEVKFNTCFERVMLYCKHTRPELEQWISDDMIFLYSELHRQGNAHSVEVFKEGELVGGLYGVHIGAVFMGESMFHIFPNASKIAFHHLIERLKQQDFKLLDSQIINGFTQKLGAIEIPRKEFKILLNEAIKTNREFII